MFVIQRADNVNVALMSLVVLAIDVSVVSGILTLKKAVRSARAT
mgnify:CR=1 FL=1